MRGPYVVRDDTGGPRSNMPRGEWTVVFETLAPGKVLEVPVDPESPMDNGGRTTKQMRSWVNRCQLYGRAWRCRFSARRVGDVIQIRRLADAD